MKKQILLSSSRAFSLSTPTFPLSNPVDNSEATWKKVTKCNKQSYESGISCLKIRGSKKGIKKKPSQFMYLISGMCIFILHLQFKCNFELPSRKNKKLYAIGLVCNIQSQQI
jgi:hypothetical protein